MMEINASSVCVAFCNDEIRKAKKKVAAKIYEKYGNEILFPIFLHIDVCNALHTVFEYAPTYEEALRFITQALNEVKEQFPAKKEE